uniref:Uncharacterized protein n=1 Tax=viral metagenome TaxID=1070528 RepID=A0A6C0JS04_9ZZZZ
MEIVFMVGIFILVVLVGIAVYFIAFDRSGPKTTKIVSFVTPSDVNPVKKQIAQEQGRSCTTCGGCAKTVSF